MAAKLTFHLPPTVLTGHEALKPYYGKLIDGFRAWGLVVALHPHRRSLLPDEVDRLSGFHVVDHGTHRHPRVLNTAVAYVYPFWHLDPLGVRSFSSIGDKTFDPALIHPEATAFVARLRRRLVGARKSRYPQPEAVTRLPAGSIAVILQSEGHRMVGETCHLGLREMVRALLARSDPSPLLVKPHPRDTDPATRAWLLRLARRDSRLRVTDANIHDILSAARAVVTINSAVGLEAMLHRKPVVLCGKADFHHCAVTVTRPKDLDGGIETALGAIWQHDRYLHWYFAGQCLNAGSPGLVEAALARIAATGFDLGLG